MRLWLAECALKGHGGVGGARASAERVPVDTRVSDSGCIATWRRWFGGVARRAWSALAAGGGGYRTEPMVAGRRAWSIRRIFVSEDRECSKTPGGMSFVIVNLPFFVRQEGERGGGSGRGKEYLPGISGGSAVSARWMRSIVGSGGGIGGAVSEVSGGRGLGGNPE